MSSGTSPPARSHAPIFWLLFGAGGMLSALFGPALVFITGIAAPLGIVIPHDLLSYPRVLALAQHWAGKSLLFVIVALFAWHAAHRLLHSLHDLGLRIGPATRLLCYGSASLLTLVSAAGLLALGF